MRHIVFLVIYLVVMVALIVGLDVAFLRDMFWPRLGVNIGIVALFMLGYLLWGRTAFR